MKKLIPSLLIPAIAVLFCLNPVFATESKYATTFSVSAFSQGVCGPSAVADIWVSNPAGIPVREIQNRMEQSLGFDYSPKDTDLFLSSEFIENIFIETSTSGKYSMNFLTDQGYLLAWQRIIVPPEEHIRIIFKDCNGKYYQPLLNGSTAKFMDLYRCLPCQGVHPGEWEIEILPSFWR